MLAVVVRRTASTWVSALKAAGLIISHLLYRWGTRRTRRESQRTLAPKYQDVVVHQIASSMGYVPKAVALQHPVKMLAVVVRRTASTWVSALKAAGLIISHLLYRWGTRRTRRESQRTLAPKYQDVVVHQIASNMGYVPKAVALQHLVKMLAVVVRQTAVTWVSALKVAGLIIPQ